MYLHASWPMCLHASWPTSCIRATRCMFSMLASPLAMSLSRKHCTPFLCLIDISLYSSILKSWFIVSPIFSACPSTFPYITTNPVNGWKNLVRFNQPGYAAVSSGPANSWCVIAAYATSPAYLSSYLPRFVAAGVGSICAGDTPPDLYLTSAGSSFHPSVCLSVYSSVFIFVCLFYPSACTDGWMDAKYIRYALVNSIAEESIRCTTWIYGFVFTTGSCAGSKWKGHANWVQTGADFRGQQNRQQL